MRILGFENFPGGNVSTPPINGFRLIVEFNLSLEKPRESHIIPSFLKSGRPDNDNFLRACL